MSLDGISTKVSIHRATDYAKEVSTQQKKAELSHLVQQAQQEVELGRTPVEDIYKPDEATIRRENEKKKKKFEQIMREKMKGEKQEEETLPAEPATGHTKIDIRI